jgi:hypothetical protein
MSSRPPLVAIPASSFCHPGLLFLSSRPLLLSSRPPLFVIPAPEPGSMPFQVRCARTKEWTPDRVRGDKCASRELKRGPRIKCGATCRKCGVTLRSVTPGLTRGPCLIECTARVLKNGPRIKCGVTNDCHPGPRAGIHPSFWCKGGIRRNT